MSFEALDDPYEKLLEEKRALDLKFEKFVATYAKLPLRRFEMYRYLDKARTELDLSTHWIDKLQITLETAIAAGTVRE